MSAVAGRRLLWLAGGVVAIAIGAALVLMDSPAEQRAERMDLRRVQDLEQLAARLDAHADVHGALPARLAVVAEGPAGPIADPETGQAYPYEVLGEGRYRLCATFARSAPADGRGATIAAIDAWRHDAGFQCFDREVRASGNPAVPAQAEKAARAAEAGATH